MANKRIRSSRTQTSREALIRLEATVPPKRRTIQKRARSVEDEIHRLECIIAAAPQATVRQQLRRRNHLPPAEDFEVDVRRSTRRVPLQQQKSLQRHRTFQWVQFSILLLAIAAIAGWMKQWLQF